MKFITLHIAGWLGAAVMCLPASAQLSISVEGVINAEQTFRGGQLVPADTTKVTGGLTLTFNIDGVANSHTCKIVGAGRRNAKTIYKCENDKHFWTPDLDTFYPVIPPDTPASTEHVAQALERYQQQKDIASAWSLWEATTAINEKEEMSGLRPIDEILPNACFQIKEIQPGNPDLQNLPSVIISNGSYQIAHDNPPMFQVNAAEGGLIAKGGLPGGAPNRSAYYFYGKSTIDLLAKGKIVINGDRPDGIVFFLLEGRGLVYFDGSGSVILNNGDIIKLPCISE